MSKHDFSAAEFADRLARSRAAVGAAGLDWLIVFHPVNILWLTGSEAKSYQAFQCLALSAAPGPLTVLTRAAEKAEFETDALVDDVWTWGGPEPEDPIEVFARLAGHLGLHRARVGIEVPGYYLHPHHYVRLKDLLGPALVAEASSLIADLKLVKSPAEIALIRRAAAIADRALEAGMASIAEGRSELQLAGAIYGAMLEQGGGLPGSTINIVSGERAGLPHGGPTLRTFRPGDTINVEYGASYRRYTATFGRQLNLGAPSPRLTELHAIVRAAADACIARMRPGVPAIEPHLAAKRVIAEAGHDRHRLHTTGYGIAPGFPPSWGEPIHMFAGSTYTLEAGMVLSVEPPIFIAEERLGVRLIDNVLVTADGAEILSGVPREILVAG
ncbi:MAG: Xaa-Pro peptidase family protein [Thalassobaculales bacterium]